jgi:tRNA pseudouridine55 synthase
LENKGILIVNKPQNFTSFDVVAKLRRLAGTRRIGHGGTLDPMATGVLPVFIGGATRAADFAASQDKEYVAGFQLGVITDTQDSTGTVLSQKGKKVDKQAVKQALADFVGEIQQLPPMYSAIQIGGKRLYELARKGQEIERPRRTITVSKMELLDFSEESQTGSFRVVCSKGTYVRTLCHDLGEALGTGGIMTALQRTRAGIYDLQQAHTLTEIEEAAEAGAFARLLIPVDSLFGQYPAVELDDYGRERAFHGAFITAEHTDREIPEEGSIARFYHQGEFIMLGQCKRLDRGDLAWFTYKKF